MRILYSVGKLISKLPLEQQIILAKEAGFNGIDYTPNIRDIFFNPNNILSLSKKHNMPIIGVHVPLLFVPKTHPIFYEKLFKFVSYFPDNELFNLHLSGFLTPLHQQNDNLKRFVDLAKKKNITISFESNPNEYAILKYYPKETYQPENFGDYCVANKLPMNLDTCHIDSWGYDIVTFFNKYHRNINVIHFSDFDGKTQHLTFGKGKLPLTALSQEMKKKSYTNHIIFEMFRFPRSATIEEKTDLLRGSIALFKKATN